MIHPWSMNTLQPWTSELVRNRACSTLHAVLSAPTMARVVLGTSAYGAIGFYACCAACARARVACHCFLNKFLIGFAITWGADTRRKNEPAMHAYLQIGIVQISGVTNVL